ncbi:cytochrome C oxidase [Noviherbaspirillum autotrophicum]|uniref:Cytochrome C oxidase n=1 Tax=Noviherbaspirillum autotrophicum TaxID=709839 RepID=A0A0C2BRC6_9BURK|nr:cytochrome C oxidase [Noviherbaspirillum autotrophicum]
MQVDAARHRLYVREAQGRHTRRRWACVWLTQLVYYGLPWLRWNGRPAVLFDLAARKFNVFGLVLWPQDFIFFAGLLALCAGLLFLASAVAGRVWCAFACPHTVYSTMFMWIENRIEGTRAARMRLDTQPLSLSGAAKKLAKHGAWLLLAVWTGITLVGYFTPIRTLLGELIAFSAGPWASFWICLYGGLAYLNAGWMREQFCKYICAYARFQSVMFDRDTLVIRYDRLRGEPRGLRRKHRDPGAPRQGDCVDCTICVQVCPTGIDIRNGFQYECIDCASCIDACDAVMDKLGMARGLIGYSTLTAAEQAQPVQRLWRGFLRPRVLGYAGILAGGLLLYVAALSLRPPIRLNVIPDRAAARLAEDGAVENVFRLQVMNMDERPRRVRIAVTGLDAIRSLEGGEYDIDAAASRSIPLRVRALPAGLRPGSHRILFTLEAVEGPALHISERSVFVVSHER